MKIRKALSLCAACLLCSPADAMMVQFPGQGFLFPESYVNNPLVSSGSNTIASMSTVNNKFAVTCRVYQKDLWFRNGNVTKNLNHVSFSTNVRAAGTATLQVDIEGVSTAAGPVPRPDGVILGGGSASSTQLLNNITNSVWYTGMPNFTAPAAVTYGQLIAVTFSWFSYTSGTFNMLGSTYTTDAAQGQANISTTSNGGTSWTEPFYMPNISLDFDDGSTGSCAQTYPYQQVGVQSTYNSGSSPNEAGMVFQVPWNVQIDALCADFAVSAAAATAVVELTDGAGNVLATTTTIDGHTARATGGTNIAPTCFPINVLSLKKNTNYVEGVKATSASNISANEIQVGLASSWDASPTGSQKTILTTRTGSGAWATPTATTRPNFSVHVSAIDDGTGPSRAPVSNGLGAVGP